MTFAELDKRLAYERHTALIERMPRPAAVFVSPEDLARFRATTPGDHIEPVPQPGKSFLRGVPIFAVPGIPQSPLFGYKNR